LLFFVLFLLTASGGIHIAKVQILLRLMFFGIRLLIVAWIRLYLFGNMRMFLPK